MVTASAIIPQGLRVSTPRSDKPSVPSRQANMLSELVPHPGIIFGKRACLFHSHHLHRARTGRKRMRLDGAAAMPNTHGRHRARGMEVPAATARSFIDGHAAPGAAARCCRAWCGSSSDWRWWPARSSPSTMTCRWVFGLVPLGIVSGLSRSITRLGGRHIEARQLEQDLRDRAGAQRSIFAWASNSWRHASDPNKN